MTVLRWVFFSLDKMNNRKLCYPDELCKPKYLYSILSIFIPCPLKICFWCRHRSAIWSAPLLCLAKLYSTMSTLNPWHAEYFFIPHSSAIFILLTWNFSSWKHGMYFQSEWKTVDPDQMASSEASWSGSAVFTNQDKSGLSRTRVNEEFWLLCFQVWSDPRFSFI